MLLACLLSSLLLDHAIRRTEAVAFAGVIGLGLPPEIPRQRLLWEPLLWVAGVGTRWLLWRGCAISIV